MRETTPLALQFRSRYLVDFISKHRVNYFFEWRKETNRGGIADICSPTPIVSLFLDLLTVKRDFFSQQQFIDYCLEHLAESPSRENQGQMVRWKLFWQAMGKPRVEPAYRARLGRNFYVPLTNQFHALVLLHEMNWFDRSWMDAEADATSKKDIVCVLGDKLPIAINMRSNSEASASASTYKQAHRSSPHNDEGYFNIYDILIDKYRPCKHGGMSFACPKDFEPIVRDYCYEGSVWGYPSIPCYWRCHQC